MSKNMKYHIAFLESGSIVFAIHHELISEYLNETCAKLRRGGANHR